MIPHLLIGRQEIERAETFRAMSPAAGEAIEPPFSIASPEDVTAACALADTAFDSFRETSPGERARFLEARADRIEALGGAVIERATAGKRIVGSAPRRRARTDRQADAAVRAGVARRTLGRRQIDSPLPDRTPLPAPICASAASRSAPSRCSGRRTSRWLSRSRAATPPRRLPQAVR